MRPAAKDSTAPRPGQDTPEALIWRLQTFIRGQFCADLTPKQWAQSVNFMRRNVILWPARFMAGKGFTLPPDRYESIMRDIFQGIIRHGKAGAVKYWPGYLMKCVQDHWRHHWEEYYAEAKSCRYLAETALLACKPNIRPENRTVEALAIAHKVLTTAYKQKRHPKTLPTQKQLPLFGP